MSTLTSEPALWTEEFDRLRGGLLAPQRTGAATSPSAHDGEGGEPTLDELLVGAWERLTVHAAVECPLCGGPMEPEYAAHALPVGGRCRDCDTALS